MGKIILFLFSILSIITPSILSAQDEKLSLEEAVEIAIQNNFQVKIARNSTNIARNRATPGNAGMYPVVDLSFQQAFSRTNTRQEFAGGVPDLERTGVGANRFNGSIDVNYTVFDGLGMFYRYDKLTSSAEAAYYDEVGKTESTALQVAVSFMESLSLKKQLEVSGFAIETSQNRLNEIKNKASLGAATSLQVLNAEVDLMTDSAAYLQDKINYEQSLADLNFLMGRNAETEIDLADDITLRQNIDYTNLKDLLNKNNYLLKKAEKDYTVSSLDVKIYEAAKYPRVFIFGSYNLNRSENEASFTRRSRTYSLNGGVGLSFNIFDGFQKQIQKQNAEISAENAALSIKELSLQIHSDLFKEYKTYEQSMEQISFEQRNLDLAIRNFEQSEEIYELGKITGTQLREAQLNLKNAQTRLNQATIQAKMSELNLLRLAGILVDQP